MSKAKHIHLTGYIEVPPNRLEAINTALPEHIRLTRQEAGCISFEVTPDTKHPNRFYVSEVFDSKEAFDAHQARTETSNWAKIAKDIPRHYQIEQRS